MDSGVNLRISIEKVFDRCAPLPPTRQLWTQHHGIILELSRSTCQRISTEVYAKAEAMGC
jgi:hypothetical protein